MGVAAIEAMRLLEMSTALGMLMKLQFFGYGGGGRPCNFNSETRNFGLWESFWASILWACYVHFEFWKKR